MIDIKTQDVYIPIDKKLGLTNYQLNCRKGKTWEISQSLEKHKNVIVLTQEEFSRVVYDAKKEERVVLMKAFDEADKLNEKIKWD